jgi:hypothetical protein
MRSAYTPLPIVGGVGGETLGEAVGGWALGGRPSEAPSPRIQADADGGGFIKRRQIAVEKDITHQLTSGLKKNIGQLYHKSCCFRLVLA